MPITARIEMPNYIHAKGVIRGLPRKFKTAFREGLDRWYERSFLPTMDDILRGVKQVPEVPPVNRPRYAAMKQMKYNIGHSLGDVPHHQHESGLLRRRMFLIQPKFTEERNVSIMSAEMPYGQPEYAYAVHEGNPLVQSQAYKFWDGAFNDTKDLVGIYIQQALTRNVGV